MIGVGLAHWIHLTITLTDRPTRDTPSTSTSAWFGR
jgi:hypothetical protein